MAYSVSLGPAWRATRDDDHEERRRAPACRGYSVSRRHRVSRSQLASSAFCSKVDVGLAVLRLVGQQLVHPVLELRGDAGEGQARGRRAPDAPGRTASRHRRTSAPRHRPPPAHGVEHGPELLPVGRRCVQSAVPAGRPAPPRPRARPPGPAPRRTAGWWPAARRGCRRPRRVLVEQHHPVGQADGGQAVGDDQRGAALHEHPQAGVDCLLHLDVDGAGGVVEHQDRRVDEQGAGDGDALALAARQRVAALAHHGVVAVGQLPDELVGPGGRGGRLDLGEVGVGRP